MKRNLILSLVLLTTAAQLALAHSTSHAQLFVRRNVTRPCPIYELPKTYNYTESHQSRSITAMSERFIYADDLDRLRQRETNEVSISRKKELFELANATNLLNRDRTILNPTVSRVPDPTATASVLESKLTMSEAERQARELIANIDSRQLLVDSQTLPVDETLRIERDHKVFQWASPKLAVDHCEISNVSVGLSRSGDWKVSFNANQNRFLTNNRFHPTRSIKRNKLSIKIRFYGTLGSTLGLATLGRGRASRAGKPVLGRLEKDIEVSVEQGKPKVVFESGVSEELSKAFDQIDRAELEFSYEK